MNNLLNNPNVLQLFQIFIAIILGIILGLDRELKRKPIGIKTCAIISTTACLLTIISIESAIYYGQNQGFNNNDPMRLAAQIVSGIGFLGAGVILHKNNDIISGLTTSAIIWASAGVGIAVGARFYSIAIMSTIVIYCLLKIVPLIIRKVYHNHSNYVRTTIHLVCQGELALDDITEQLTQKYSAKLESTRIVNVDEQRTELILRLLMDTKINTTELYTWLNKYYMVYSVDIQN